MRIFGIIYMHLKNRFKNEDKMRVWLDHQYCTQCGSNNMCSIHHIKSTESSSILNSSMLCHSCHKTADGNNQSNTEFMARLLQQTMKIVLRSGYKLNEKDIAFYNQNKKLYDMKI